MKLDKFKFAELLNMLGSRTRHEFDAAEIKDIDAIIEFEVAEPAQKFLDIKELDELLKLMMNAHGINFIPAIKQYRAITGTGLKEAKEAVEQYRVKPLTKEFLVKALNNTTYHSHDYNIIASFIEKLGLTY